MVPKGVFYQFGKLKLYWKLNWRFYVKLSWSILQRIYVFCLDWSENECWSMLIIQAQDNYPLYAQFDYGSWLLWWLSCEYCDSFFLSFFDNNAQYRRKIVAKSWIQNKARSTLHGKLPPSIIWIYNQLSCGQHAAKMLPTCYHALSFCFFSHPHT